MRTPEPELRTGYVCDWVTGTGNPCGENATARISANIMGYSGYTCSVHLVTWVRWIQSAASSVPGIEFTTWFVKWRD
jgi:hypothetical protein